MRIRIKNGSLKKEYYYFGPVIGDCST